MAGLPAWRVQGWAALRHRRTDLQRTMGKQYPEIDEELAGWIARQKMFFVATAPLAADGLLNCSPKGIDTFRVLGPRTVGYLDLTGSGIETVAHLRENGRVVIMMCAFEGAPNIVRLHGRGEVLEKGTAGYRELVGEFAEHPGARSIIRVEVDRISDSCGFGVPFYSYQGERDTLLKWAEKQGEDGVAQYQEKSNRESIDGLEGMRGMTRE